VQVFSEPPVLLRAKLVLRFQVCDQPHPTKVKAILDSCIQGDIHAAQAGLQDLWSLGQSLSRTATKGTSA
jgi:hypothetical protein